VAAAPIKYRMQATQRAIGTFYINSIDEENSIGEHEYLQDGLFYGC